MKLIPKWFVDMVRNSDPIRTNNRDCTSWGMLSRLHQNDPTERDMNMRRYAMSKKGQSWTKTRLVLGGSSRGCTKSSTRAFQGLFLLKRRNANQNDTLKYHEAMM